MRRMPFQVVSLSLIAAIFLGQSAPTTLPTTAPPQQNLTASSNIYAGSGSTFAQAMSEARLLLINNATEPDQGTAEAFDTNIRRLAALLDELANGGNTDSLLPQVREAYNLLVQLNSEIRSTQHTGELAQHHYDLIWQELSDSLTAVTSAANPSEAQSAALAAAVVIKILIVPEPEEFPPSTHPDYEMPDPGAPTVSPTAAATLASTDTPAPEDLAPTVEVQITQEIRDLASSLGNSPLRIYTFVRNEVAFDPYYGSLKGSTATLWTRSGNAYDQTSLLIALLRASEIPARYVRGVVTIPGPQALDWLGLKSLDAAERTLRAAGVPAAVIHADGVPVALQLEHAWAEAYLSYEGLPGKVWVPLDASFKLRRYQPGIVLPTELRFDRDTFLNTVSPYLAVEAFADQVRAYLHTNQPGRSLSDVPYTGPIIPEEFGVLPASLPYQIDGITGHSAEVPDSMRHKVSIWATGKTSALGPDTFVPTTTLTLAEVALSRITLSFPPDKAEPIMIRPVLKVDGVAVATATLAMASAFDIETRVGFIAPGQGLIAEVSHPSGLATVRGYRAITIDARQIDDRLIEERSRLLIEAMALAGTPQENQEAIEGELLAIAGLRYFQRVNRANELATSLYGYRLPPRVAELMTYQRYQHPFLRAPYATEIDVRWAPWTVYGIDGDDSRWLELMRLLGANGSAMEHQIWEEMVQVGAISTIKGLQYAAETGIEILRLDQSNVGRLSEIQGLGFIALQITLDIQAGRTIIIHKQRIRLEERPGAPNLWSGFAWISEDPTKREVAGYLIAGQIVASTTAQVAAVPTPPTLGGALINWLGGLFGRPGPGATGVPRDPAASAGDPVTVTNGNMYHQVNDFVIPSRGHALQLTRTYNAQSQEDGPFGYGWTHSYAMRLAEEAGTGDIIFTNGSGGSYRFVRQGVTYVHPKGVFLTLAKGPTGFNLRDRFGVRWTFSLGGRLLNVTDRHGNIQSLTYSGDRLTLLTDALGRSLSFSYDGAGRITSVADFTGRTWGYIYSSDGNLLSSTSPATADTPAAVMAYTYYTQEPWQHNIKTITDPRGQVITFRYDSSGRVAQTVEPEGRYTTFHYLPFRNETQVVTARGFTWIYRYDAEGFITRIERPDKAVVERTWDTVGNLTAVVDGLGRLTTMTYDGRGNMLSRTDTLGAAISLTYDAAFSQVTSVTDPRGHITRYEVDAADGDILAATDPLGKTSRFSYDAFGNLTGLTDTLGRSATLGYDGNDYLASVTDARGQRWSLTHDALGRLTAVANPLGETSTYAYDIHDRLTVLTDGEGNMWRYAYDIAGNLITLTDPNGATTGYAYDGLGNVIAVTDALGGVTRLSYKSQSCAGCLVTTGNLTAITNPNGHTRRYVYDNLDRLIGETDPLGHERRYVYDAQGNLISSTDERGVATVYRYDAVGRLLEAGFADGTSERFSYDAAGNLLSAENAATTLSYAYDALNRVSEATNSALVKTLRYAYDDVGNLATLTLPDGSTQRYSYDPNNNLSALTGADGIATTFGYDAAGRLTGVAPQAGSPGVGTSMGYDRAGRLSRLSSTSPDGAVSFFDLRYSYDKVGNVTGVAATGLPEFGALVGQTAYSYDALYRLTAASQPSQAEQRYAYDPAGNRLSAGPVAAPARSFHDEADRLLYGGGGGAERRYDERGNLVAVTEGGRTTRYSWDDQGQLVRIDHPDGSTTNYAYDAFGRRVSKALAGGAVVRYLYDGPNILQEYDGAAALQATYTHALGVDQPLRMARGGQTSHYLYDRLGSVVGLSDGAQGLRTTYAYDAWGNQVGGTGNVENPFRYTGREYDAESGLYYYRARYYDPGAGRFISEDPIGVAGGLNLYGYVANNPVNLGDPSGLKPNTKPGGGSRAAGADGGGAPGQGKGGGGGGGGASGGSSSSGKGGYENNPFELESDPETGNLRPKYPIPTPPPQSEKEKTTDGEESEKRVDPGEQRPPGSELDINAMRRRELARDLGYATYYGTIIIGGAVIIWATAGLAAPYVGPAVVGAAASAPALAPLAGALP